MTDEIQGLKIGDKLRERREAHGLSTIQLAKRCDLSEARLMAIEEGFAMPTISILLRLARELGVGVGHFFQDEDVKKPVEVIRKKDRITVAQEKKEGVSEGLYYNYEALTITFPDAAMKPFFVEVKTGDHSYIEPSSHRGQEFNFVLEGAVEWRSDTESHRLEAGDAIYYNSEIPHKIIGLGDTNAKVLAVVYDED
jgi:transcriptional regulator with XRE-family HTH domain